MTRAEAWFAHATTALVGGTGLIYGWMRYLATPEDEFAVVNHPWQPALQSLHILFAPLTVFACALVWRNHVWARVRSGYPSRRRTGLILFGAFFPMVFSGYLLQTATAEVWNAVWIWTHGLASCLWLGTYLVHQLTSRGERRT
jgi:hypothetical protein